jgi:tRNA (guanine37-N1)-methyltransferase
MRIDVVTIFPPMVEAIAGYGVTGRAIQNGLVSLRAWNPRDFADNSYRRVDERPYGGGPGMVMMPEPLTRTIAAVKKEHMEGTKAQTGHPCPAPLAPVPSAKVSYLSPQGRVLDHTAVSELAARPGLILLAGRYEGIDERLIESVVDEEWSLGDYVLSGGELAALVVIDAVVRQLPGVLGDEDSAEQDSFVRGLLDCPHYTRPEVFEGRRVPEVLLSGDHERIRRWRLKQSLGRTWLRRPDLLAKLTLDDEQKELLEEFRRELTAGGAQAAPNKTRSVS